MLLAIIIVNIAHARMCPMCKVPLNDVIMIANKLNY